MMENMNNPFTVRSLFMDIISRFNSDIIIKYWLVYAVYLLIGICFFAKMTDRHTDG